jgi:Zn-dependent alcohol dehydrogenase
VDGKAEPPRQGEVLVRIVAAGLICPSCWTGHQNLCDLGSETAEGLQPLDRAILLKRGRAVESGVGAAVFGSPVVAVACWPPGSTMDG